MAIELDHVLVPARNRWTSAALIARILDVPWSETDVDPFSPVFVNDGRSTSTTARRRRGAVSRAVSVTPSERRRR